MLEKLVNNFLEKTELHNFTGYIKSQMDKRINWKNKTFIYSGIYAYVNFFLEGYLETANRDSLWEEGVGGKLPS